MSLSPWARVGPYSCADRALKVLASTGEPSEHPLDPPGRPGVGACALACETVGVPDQRDVAPGKSSDLTRALFMGPVRRTA